jgi:hypothetical protein
VKDNYSEKGITFQCVWAPTKILMSLLILLTHAWNYSLKYRGYGTIKEHTENKWHVKWLTGKIRGRLGKECLMNWIKSYWETCQSKNCEHEKSWILNVMNVGWAIYETAAVRRHSWEMQVFKEEEKQRTKMLMGTDELMVMSLCSSLTWVFYMYTQKQIFTGKTTAHKQNFCQYTLFRTQINK